MHWYHLIRRFRGRASKWHRGEQHHEVVCSYEEWLAVMTRAERREHFVRVCEQLALPHLPEVVLRERAHRGGV